MVVDCIISVQQAAAAKDVFWFDCRAVLGHPGYGEEAYLLDHVPDATYINLETELSGEIIPGVTGRHPLPDKQAFADCLKQKGLHKNQSVIAYDADNGAFAARLWWMLRWIGHTNVSVMNGGFAAWKAAGLPTTNILPSHPTGDIEVNNLHSINQR